ncbi:MAG TPA: hypothetical protein VLC11_04375, partial [Gemmatimonadales bacterium]|nr:hypothetical protein [Gemmatimonadales bacterium]
GLVVLLGLAALCLAGTLISSIKLKAHWSRRDVEWSLFTLNTLILDSSNYDRPVGLWLFLSLVSGMGLTIAAMLFFARS